MAAMQHTSNSLGQAFSLNNLEGIMESFTESQRSCGVGGASGMDDFDPEGLLNQPLYEDSHNSLNFSKTSLSGFMSNMEGSPLRSDSRVVEGLSIKIPEPDPLPDKAQTLSGPAWTGTSTSTSATMHQHHQSRQHHQHYQQSQQDQSINPSVLGEQRSSAMVDQTQQYPTHSEGGAQQGQQPDYTMSPSKNNMISFNASDHPGSSPTRDEVEQKVHEINEQLRLVQEQIQRVQFQSSQLENENTMQMQQTPQQQQQQQQPHQGQLPQQQKMLHFATSQQQNTARSEGFVRRPPGRSVSMPVSVGARPELTASNFVPQFQVHQTGAVSNLPVTISPMNGMIPGGFGTRPIDDNSMHSMHSMHSNASSHVVPNTVSSNQQHQQASPMNSNTPSPKQDKSNGIALMGMRTGDMNASPLTVCTQQSQQVAFNMQIHSANSDDTPTSLSSASTPTSQPPNVNEAMEKLCESMRRSAMSRSMVKQLSGRSLPQQNSARNLLSKQASTRTLSRQNSARGTGLMRQNSGLRRQKSGRGLSRTNSGLGLDGSASGTVPVRRPSHDPKHRLGPPNRGIYRHKSQSAIIGMRNNGGINGMQGSSVSYHNGNGNNLNTSLHSGSSSGGGAMIQKDNNNTATGMF